MMHFFCSAGRGTEKFAAAEIRRKLDGQDIQVTDGKVFFCIDGKRAESICQLKSIERAFVEVSRHLLLDGVKTVKDVGKLVLSPDIWTNADLADLVARIHNQHGNNDYCPQMKKRRTEESSEPLITFRVSCKCAGRIRRNIQPRVLSKHIGCGLQRFVNWKVDLRNPSIEICVHLNDDRLTVGIPLQGCPLSKRSYIRHFGLRSTVAWIMTDLLDVQPGDVVLDPMCGKATILVEAQHNFRDATYLGLDTSEDQLSKALENLQWSHHHGNIGLLRGDARYIPLPSESIHRVICDAPFGQNHLPDCDDIVEFYSDVLAEIFRVLKPEGRLVLLTSQRLSGQICDLCGQSDDKERKETSRRNTGSQEGASWRGTDDTEGGTKRETTDGEHYISSSTEEKLPTGDGHTSKMEGKDSENDKSDNIICNTHTDEVRIGGDVVDTSVENNNCEVVSTSYHGDATVTILKDGSCPQDSSGQGHVCSCPQGHKDKCGVHGNIQTTLCSEIKQDDLKFTGSTSDNDTIPSTCLDTLQFMEKHYVKLGETDATICVFDKVIKR